VITGLESDNYRLFTDSTVAFLMPKPQCQYAILGAF
jgi:hypothetical protein